MHEEERYMTPQKQSALLLILVCVFAACTERNDTPLLETDIPNTQVEESIPTEQGTPTFSLAAWNIRIFSNGSRNNAELHHIAKVLIDYDFIAIVELRDETVLIRTEAILEGMGRNYDYVMSPPVGAKVKERYAFLFDPQIVRVIEDGEVFPDPNDAFLREPYFATFKAGEFDFHCDRRACDLGRYGQSASAGGAGTRAGVSGGASSRRRGAGRDTVRRFQS